MKLKPCPFCGAIPKENTTGGRKPPQEDFMPYVVIRCENAGCCANVSTEGFEKTAERAWNTRAGEPAEEKTAHWDINTDGYYPFCSHLPSAAKAADHKAAAIMAHYGAEKQLVVLAEECGELIQECCKCLRLGIPFSEDMVYEMADVIVMIKEFKAVFPEYYLDKLEETIRFKLQRQIERIENELGHEHKA